MISAGANLRWENSVSDGSQCIVNNRKFKMKRRRESKKRNSLTRQNNNFARASRFFAYTVFLCRHCTTSTWKCLISRFVKDVNKQWQNFFLFMNLDMVDRNSIPEEVACIWQSKWVRNNHDRDWKNVSSLFMRRFRGCQLSWHLKLPNATKGVDKTRNMEHSGTWKIKVFFLWKN